MKLGADATGMKLGAAATGMKLGAAATGMKLGAAEVFPAGRTLTACRVALQGVLHNL